MNAVLVARTPCLSSWIHDSLRALPFDWPMACLNMFWGHARVMCGWDSLPSLPTGMDCFTGVTFTADLSCLAPSQQEKIARDVLCVGVKLGRWL
jgi:hypothetical protein